MRRFEKSVPISWLKPNPRNTRAHPKRQITAIARNMTAFGVTAPVIADETGLLLAGHARLAAARQLKLAELPAVILEGLSETQKRAIVLSDNKIAEGARWDRERLAVELPELTELLVLEGLDISITGFEPFDIDQIMLDHEENAADPADEIEPFLPKGPILSRRGQLWQLGKHRLVCGSALDGDDIGRLMGSERAAVAFLDPPYNVKISEIVGRGRTKHPDFAMASGEMSGPEFQGFLHSALTRAAAVSVAGAVHFICMDWRGIAALIAAGTQVYGEMLNLIAWVKANAGQGSFYRSQHELIAAFKVGRGPHLNNVELGKHGRNRSNVWRYAGVNSFGAARLSELAVHPTVKPIAMIADALKDCSRRGDIVLDTFCGSGSTILAAERVGRRAFGVELEPRYVDASIRRWQFFTGKDAVDAATGETFDDVAMRTAAEPLGSDELANEDDGCV